MAFRWDVAGPEPLLEASFEGHADWVNDLALIGDLLITCSNDQTVRLWKAGSDNGEAWEQAEGRRGQGGGGQGGAGRGGFRGQGGAGARRGAVQWPGGGLVGRQRARASCRQLLHRSSRL
ncbi:hypothetical protein PLESTM_001662200 [Pleodorina starrii]|nr:hypothetical protein PLESTM_001662200 [Pleodorina starrii]